MTISGNEPQINESGLSGYEPMLGGALRPATAIHGQTGYSLYTCEDGYGVVVEYENGHSVSFLCCDFTLTDDDVLLSAEDCRRWDGETGIVNLIRERSHDRRTPDS